jgi:hypothetical protein
MSFPARHFDLLRPKRRLDRVSDGILIGWVLFTVAAVSLPADQRVIILTPHVDAIRHEFERGFAEWHLRNHGETARVEWRNVGGTSDALRFIQSEFAKKPEGIGLDILFGGGQEPYLVLADKGFSSRYQPPEEVLAGIPQNLQGMDVYDANYTWFAAALSSFGILQNTRLQRALGL